MPTRVANSRVALLAAAGVLKGRRATANWGWHEQVRAYGVDVVAQRYVRDGKIVTGAGVSASIDTGLFLAGLLAGEEVARMIQLGLEYYPQPPFGGTDAFAEPAAFRDAVLHYDEQSVPRLAVTAPAWAAPLSR